MPYYRRPYRRYRRRNYRRYPKKGNGATDYIKMAKAAYNGVNYLRTLVNVEKKFRDRSFVVNPDNITGDFSLINAIAQGDTASDRSGNSVKSWKFNINFRYTINSSATHTTVRTIILIDKECNGVAPLITDILNATTIDANYNHNESSRFMTLYDKNVSLSSTGTQETTRNVFRKLGFHTHYEGSAATIADIVDNALWVFLVSDEATNTPTVQVRSQFLFLDN